MHIPDYLIWFIFCRNDENIRKLWDGGETDQIWAKQLTNLYGDEWKDVRYSKTADQPVWRWLEGCQV